MAALRSTLIWLSFSIAAWSKVCTVLPQGNGNDSSPAILQAFQECASDSTIIFQGGIDYVVYNPVAANLSNVTIQVDGNIHLSQNITHMQ